MTNKIILVATLFACVMPMASQQHAPLPDKVVAARTVFLMNESGQPKLGDAVYKQIRTWNQWKIATDRADADLILTVSNKGGLNPSYYLSLTDAKSGEQLWTSRTSMQGKLWRTWNAIAKDLVSDIRERMK